MTLDLNALNFEKAGGLVTVVAQDADSGLLLMVAHADREALIRTLSSGEMHYRSRTRGAWHKGATSGSIQRVVSLHADCDGDAVLARVRPAGPACHTGAATCFTDAPMSSDTVRSLDAVINQRLQASHAVNAGEAGYTARLLADSNLRLKKLGEESAELIIACLGGDRERIAAEGADLLYHMLVSMRAAGVGWDDVTRVLADRRAGSPT